MVSEVPVYIPEAGPYPLLTWYCLGGGYPFLLICQLPWYLFIRREYVFDSRPPYGGHNQWQ